MESNGPAKPTGNAAPPEQSTGLGQLPIKLGCPVWNCEHWADSVYPPGTSRKDWLRWYSRMFNTVEGNSSFYGIPLEKNVERWANEVEPGFMFCMKFPREVTHDHELVNAEGAMAQFLGVLRILQKHNCLGPSFIQLGPNFAPHRLPILEAFLDALPSEMPWAVEVRHHDWFDSADNEKRLNAALRKRNVDKVIFDSRPLFQSPPDDEVERVSQSRKPKTPVRQTITGKHPFLRLVGRNTINQVDRYIAQWASIAAGWIRDGLVPYIFTHAPDDAFAPELARRFWAQLQLQLASAGNPPPDLPRPPKPAKQLDLF